MRERTWRELIYWYLRERKPRPSSASLLCLVVGGSHIRHIRKVAGVNSHIYGSRFPPFPRFSNQNSTRTSAWADLGLQSRPRYSTVRERILPPSVSSSQSVLFRWILDYLDLHTYSGPDTPLRSRFWRYERGPEPVCRVRTDLVFTFNSCYTYHIVYSAVLLG